MARLNKALSGIGIWAAAGLIAAACASTEEPTFNNSDASANGAAGFGTGGTGMLGTGGTGLPTAGTTGTGGFSGSSPTGTGGATGCNVMFCPSSFGTPCCLPTGGCGYDFGMGCTRAPTDAGPGGSPGRGGSTGTGGFTATGGSSGAGGSPAAGGSTGMPDAGPTDAGNGPRRDGGGPPPDAPGAP